MDFHYIVEIRIKKEYYNRPHNVKENIEQMQEDVRLNCIADTIALFATNLINQLCRKY